MIKIEKLKCNPNCTYSFIRIFFYY